MSTWLLLCFQTIHKIVYLFNFSVFRIDIYFLMISMGLRAERICHPPLES